MVARRGWSVQGLPPSYFSFLTSVHIIVITDWRLSVTQDTDPNSREQCFYHLDQKDSYGISHFGIPTAKVIRKNNWLPLVFKQCFDTYFRVCQILETGRLLGSLVERAASNCTGWMTVKERPSHTTDHWASRKPRNRLPSFKAAKAILPLSAFTDSNLVCVGFRVIWIVATLFKTRLISLFLIK